MAVDMDFKFLGPLYNEIGVRIMGDIGGDPDGVFLYAEAGDGWVEASIFKDMGSFVQYYSPSGELCDLIIEAWEAEAPDKRWATMSYEINAGAFDTALDYPEDINPDDSSFERSERILKQRYGDKPIRYPPILRD